MHERHFRHCWQYPRRPFLGEARPLDFSASQEAHWNRRAVARSARFSDAVLRSASDAGDARPAGLQNEVVQRWTAAIAQSDGFVFVTPEYNYGPSTVLKNAIDWVYPEWHRKAVCFVSYGSAAGVRSVQQLRQSVIEIQLAPIRSSVHIPVATLWAHYQGGDVDAGFAELEAPAAAMIEDLLWWTAALKTARAGALRPAVARLRA